MSKLNVETGYDEIQWCPVCGKHTENKDAIDNHTVVIINCPYCKTETMITLFDEEVQDYDY